MRAGWIPTVINGGIINRYGSNARLGKSDWMVVEADESDGSFLRLDGTIAVVTNIDPEHLEHYGGFDEVKKAYCEFIENVPFYGLAVMCVDHPEVQNVIGRIRDRRIVTYGFSALADLRADNATGGSVAGAIFDAIVLERDGSRRTIEDITVPMPGRHNVQNALAAIAVALELGLSDDQIREGFARFDGVKRRFTKVGEFDGVPMIDDYAHHPVEIRAVLSAARESADQRVIAVMQPHRFTRLHDLMEDFQNAFNDADVVFVAPVYAAGEEPIEGVDSEALVEGLRSHGHRMVRAVADMEDLCSGLRDLAAPGRSRHLHGCGRHHQMGGEARRWPVPGEGQQVSVATLAAGSRQAQPRTRRLPRSSGSRAAERRMAVRAHGRGRSRLLPSSSSIPMCR